MNIMRILLLMRFYIYSNVVILICSGMLLVDASNTAPLLL